MVSTASAMCSRPAASFLSLWLFAACHGAPPSPPAPSARPAPADGRLACTLALLKTGPRPDPGSEEQRREIFAGHFRNMARLADERDLLLAGPFGRDRSDPALRGVFVLDTDDPARARALAETDPACQAGVFALEYHALVTEAPLRAFLAAVLARQQAIVASGRTPEPGEGGRGYALLTADDGDAAAAALAGHPAVLCFARLDRDRALVWLDAANAVAGRELLAPLADRLGPFHVDDWFGSGLLVELPRLAAPGPPE